MSDIRMRTLQREAATGDPVARRLLLQAQLRAGLLPPERLELFAYLGHEDAREALGESLGEDLSLEVWVEGLRDWGPRVEVGAAIAAAWQVLPLWEGRPEQIYLPRSLAQGEWHRWRGVSPRRALEAADAWFDCPCPRHAIRCKAESRFVDAVDRHVWRGDWDTRPNRLAAQCCAHTAKAAAARRSRKRTGWVARALDEAVHAVANDELGSLSEALVHIRQSVGATLLLWLGELEDF